MRERAATPRSAAHVGDLRSPRARRPAGGRLRLFRDAGDGALVPLTRAAQEARTAHPQNCRKTPEPSRISSATPAAFTARDTGLEPVAFGSGGQRSIQLS